MRAWRWVHEGWLKGRWVLVEGGRRVAVFQVPGVTEWRPFEADVDIGSRRHGIRRERRVGWSFSLSDAGSREVGRLDVRWTGRGRLTLADGRRFEWRPLNVWATAYALSDEKGQRVLTYDLAPALKAEGSVTLEDDALPEELAAALAALTWHRLVYTANALAGPLVH